MQTENKHYADKVAFKRSEYTSSAEDAVIEKVVKAFNPNNCVPNKPCICCPSFCRCNGID